MDRYGSIFKFDKKVEIVQHFAENNAVNQNE